MVLPSNPSSSYTYRSPASIIGTTFLAAGFPPGDNPGVRFAALALALAGCSASPDADVRLIAGSTRVIAHRGGTGPDGTVAGCLRSLDRGIAFLELDVRLTRDRAAVILHDPTVDRTTDGKGPVDALTLAQLRRLDAGARFHPSFAGERVPTVAELLRAVGRRGVVLLELKVPEAAGPVVEAIRAEAAFDRAVVRTASEEVLREIRGADPRVRTGTMAAIPEAVEPFVARLAELGVSAFTPKDNAPLTPDLVRAFRARGIAVWGTNTNDEVVMRHLIRCGVDGIITDRPEELRRLLDAIEPRRPS